MSYHTYWHVMECVHFDQSLLPFFCVHGLNLWGINCSNAPQKALTKPGTGTRNPDLSLGAKDILNPSAGECNNIIIVLIYIYTYYIYKYIMGFILLSTPTSRSQNVATEQKNKVSKPGIFQMPWFLEKRVYILLVVFKSVEQNMSHNQSVHLAPLT